MLLFSVRNQKTAAHYKTKEVRMLYMKDEKKPKTGWLVLAVILIGMIPTIMSVWISANYQEFGMTNPEVTTELWLVALYFIVGGLGIYFAGRLIRNRNLVFFIRLMIATAVIVLCHNQLSVSQALAPVKAEFAQAAAACRVKEKKLVCGKELDAVLEKRDRELERMKAVRVGDWKVVAIDRYNYIFDRDSAYFCFPF